MMKSTLTHQGWIKNCLILSFYWLLRASKIEQHKEILNLSIRKTIQCGGDTDTNACVVGGMIGAFVGFKALDPFLVGKIFSFDCTKDG
jgi:ADP-ribosyl-[dinitrogen reductase] hydrolase